jgi:hypothetical protein
VTTHRASPLFQWKPSVVSNLRPSLSNWLDDVRFAGKCIIFKYDDDAKEDELPLVELSEGQSSMDSQGVDTDGLDTRAASVDELMHVGGGKWSDDDHLFYYRTSLLGLGKNWRRTLKKFVRSRPQTKLNSSIESSPPKRSRRPKSPTDSPGIVPVASPTCRTRSCDTARLKNAKANGTTSAASKRRKMGSSETWSHLGSRACLRICLTRWCVS